VLKKRAFEAVPNFSEGRDQALLEMLAAERHVVDVHSDADHNRSVLTLAGADVSALSDVVFAMVTLATERIDMRRHSGVHPRVGATDVVPFVPLGEATLSDAVSAALALGKRIWRELGVPVYFYGDAARGRRLADVRAGRVQPDLGGAHHPTAGAVCVGARQGLVAFNVAFSGLAMVRARRIASLMRELPGVQALAFQLSGARAQISMNLTRLNERSVPEAYRRACDLAGLRGEPELVGLCPAAAAGPGCDGRLLEARLAAAAARLAAQAAHDRGGDEMARMAERLNAESRSLAAIPARQEPMLAGSERAAALLRVLVAAGLSTPELDALLALAAAGLRDAVTPETAAQFHQRVDLIDTWLESLS
jgi:glutamate formiminotransferase / 5-formyltetrahydrofolate cyclo-ligase